MSSTVQRNCWFFLQPKKNETESNHDWVLWFGTGWLQRCWCLLSIHVHSRDDAPNSAYKTTGNRFFYGWKTHRTWKFHMVLPMGSSTRSAVVLKAIAPCFDKRWRCCKIWNMTTLPLGKGMAQKLRGALKKSQGVGSSTWKMVETNAFWKGRDVVLIGSFPEPWLVQVVKWCQMVWPAHPDGPVISWDCCWPLHLPGV